MIHEDQVARTEAAIIARERFDREAEELIKERKIPMTDSFSGKYEMIAA